MIQEVGTQLKMDFAYHAIVHSTVFEGNNGALGLTTSPRTTPSTRHIALKYHFFRENVCEGKGITIQSVEYKEQKYDFFTKGLSV